MKTTEMIKELASKAETTPYYWTQGGIFTGTGKEMNMLYDVTVACSTFETDNFVIESCNNAARMAELLECAVELIRLAEPAFPEIGYGKNHFAKWLSDFDAFQNQKGRSE